MGTCSPTVLQGSYSTKCGTAAPRKVRVRASQDVQPGASRVPRINAAASPIGRHPIHVRSPLRGQSAYPLAQISHPGSFSVRGRLARSRRVGISRQHAAGDSCQAAGGDRDVPASPPSRQRPLHSLPLSDYTFCTVPTERAGAYPRSVGCGTDAVWARSHVVARSRAQLSRRIGTVGPIKSRARGDGRGRLTRSSRPGSVRY